MFLLDTNVISDLRRPDKAPASLLAWSRSVSAHTLFISCITLFELELGVRQRERRDPVQGSVLREWLDTRVVTEFEGRVLDIDGPIARRCAAAATTPASASARGARRWPPLACPRPTSPPASARR